MLLFVVVCWLLIVVCYLVLVARRVGVCVVRCLLNVVRCSWFAGCRWLLVVGRGCPLVVGSWLFVIVVCCSCVVF